LAEYKRADDWSIEMIGVAALGAWILWSAILIPIAFSVGPQSVGMRLHRLLIGGSFLELVVAVPTHLVVRRRSECCAGMETGMAICFGIAVAFISLGPSVLFLYQRRVRGVTGEGKFWGFER
jgi:hypothetical protein